MGTCSHLSFSMLKGNSSKPRNPVWERLGSDSLSEITCVISEIPLKERISKD